MRLYVYILFIFLFIKCNKTNSEMLACASLINSKGLVLLNDKPFSGMCSDTTYQHVEIRSYRNGQAHGTWEKYSKNGTLVYKGSYAEGHINGNFTSYHPNGMIKGIGSLDKGFRIGTWIYYDSLGIEIQKKMYSRNGTEIIKP